MAFLNVGPSSTYRSIAAAMLDAAPADTIVLEGNYSNESADILYSGMTIFGGAGSQGITLRLGPGVSSVSLTGLAPMNVIDAPGGNAIVGNDGNNQVTVTGGADAVNGGLGTDRLIVDYSLAIGNITGDSTSNFTEAGGGARMVTITAGTIEHFTILTGSGADTITTGNGNDIIRTGSGASTITAGHGANTIVGGDDADTITALDGGNWVNAGNGANTITTGAGNDTILSGINRDVIVSGAGNDRITLRGGADTVNAGAGFDRLIIDYSGMTTDVTGGVTGGNLVAGYTGEIASTVGDRVGFVEAEAFNITTGSGNDSITTGDASDNVIGGTGNDTLRSSGENDVVRGGLGNDNIGGGTGNDLLYADDGADIIWGGWGHDTIFGGLGNDTISGGGDGTNRLFGDDGSDRIFAGDGGDFIGGGAGNDTIRGGDGADTIYGGYGNDNIGGGEGNDLIFGSTGNNTIWGGLGDDTIHAGTGRDVFLGGPGADTFIFASAAHVGIGAARDIVTDFIHGTDHIDLRALDTTFNGTAGFSGDGQASFYYFASSGLLIGDQNGNGIADWVLELSGAPTITAGDFLL